MAMVEVNRLTKLRVVMSIMAMSLLNQLSLSNNNYKSPINHCNMAGLLSPSLSSSADVQSQSSLLQFRFDDFLQSCSAQPSTSSSSPQEEILADSFAIDEGGNTWRLSLIRKNNIRQNENHHHEHHVTVSMVLVKERTSASSCNRRLNDETTTFCFMIKDLLDNIVYEETFQYSTCKEDEDDDNTTTSTGFMKSFNMRGFKVDDLILVDGALTIDVAVHVMSVVSKTRTAAAQTHHSQSLERLTLCSNNPFRMNMLNLLHSGTNADVAFDINGTITLAHKFIINANAPALARLYDGIIEHSTINKPITIVNTSPEAFRYLLHYIYGGRAPGTSDMLSLGKDLIAIAYRFQVLSLKDEVERALIKQCVVDTSNCIDFIFFANKYDCILLTRHAISYFIAHSQDLLDSESSKRLQQYPQLMHAIMFQMAGKSNDNDEEDCVAEKQKQRLGVGERFKRSLKGLMNKFDKHKSNVHDGKMKKSRRRQVSPSSTSSVAHSKKIKSYDDDTTTLVPVEEEELSSEEVRNDARRVLEAVDNKHRSRRSWRTRRQSSFSSRNSSGFRRRSSASSFSNNTLLQHTHRSRRSRVSEFRRRRSSFNRRSSAFRLSTSIRRRRRSSLSNSTLMQHTMSIDQAQNSNRFQNCSVESRYLRMHGSEGWIKS